MSSSNPSSPLDSVYSWQRLALSMGLSVLGSIGIWAFILILPQVQKDFGIDRGTASLAFTATMLGFAVGNLFGGRLVDRYSVFVALVLAALAESAGFALSAATTNFWILAVAHGALVGLGSAVAFGPLIADVSHWFHRRRGIAIAAIASANYIAGTVWPLVLNPVIAAGGWRAGYATIAAILAFVMVPMAFTLRRKPPHQTGTAGLQNPVTHTTGLSQRALVILLALAGIGCCVAMSMPQVHIVALCVDRGFGSAAGGKMLSLMLAGGIVSRLASGWLADHVGGVYTLLLGSSLQCLALFLYIPFDGLASLYIVSLIFGLSQGGIVPSYAIIVREYLPAKVAGERVGLVIMGTVMGMALGGWMSGWIYDQTQSYLAAFVNGIAWNLLNITIIVLILFKTKITNAASPA